MIRKMLLGYNLNLIINSRLMGYGDYETPEQNFPITLPELQTDKYVTVVKVKLYGPIRLEK